MVASGTSRLQLPNQHPAGENTEKEREGSADDAKLEAASSGRTEELVSTPKAQGKQATLEPAPLSETPSTQDHPSEGASTSPTTPISVQPNAASVATPTQSAKLMSRPAIPAVPVVPVLPKSSPKEAKPLGKPEVDSTGGVVAPADEATSTEKPV